MDTIVQWFWRRFRNHYFFAVAATVVMTTSLGLIVPMGILFTHIFRLQAGEGAVVSFTCWLVLPLAAYLGLRAAGEFRWPIEAWIAGDHSDPELVRDCALVSGQRTVERGVIYGAPIALATISLVLRRYVHIGWRGFIAAMLLIFTAGILAAFLAGVGSTLLARPLLEEVSAEITTARGPTTSAWSLRGRLLTGVLLGGLACGVGAGGIGYLFSTSLENSFIATFAAGIVMAIYCTVLFKFGLIDPTLTPLQDVIDAIKRVREGQFDQRLPVMSTDEFGEIAVALNDMMHGLQQRTALQAAFGSYVDPSLAQRLLDQRSSVFDGEAVKATIFFADVRGFTTYADQVTPEKAVARLNRLFDILVPAIRDAGGHPNRYTGDGVLAVFGTPEPLIDHAERAIEAAITIQRGIYESFGDGLRMGIGINTGRVIAGTIGGGGKLDFTVIGDAVNIAARVEEMTKETGDHILLTQATVDACVDTPANLLPRGPHPVRGKATSVVVYAVHC